MKYLLLCLVLLSGSVFSSTDCETDALGGFHCDSSDGTSTDCEIDALGGMHCN